MQSQKKATKSDLKVKLSLNDDSTVESLRKRNSRKKNISSGTPPQVKKLSKLKRKPAERENESIDEIYELFKREEKVKNQMKKKKKSGSIVLKNIQVSTPTVQVRGKKREHFEFGISPINLNNSMTTIDNYQTTKELCDSLRRQRLKEIKEQTKIMESSAILRAKALLEKLRKPRNPEAKKSLEKSASLDMWDEVKPAEIPPKRRLTKRQLSLDDSDITKRKLICTENDSRIISQNLKVDDDIDSETVKSSTDNDVTVDNSVSNSLPVPSIEIHDDASQTDEKDEDRDENQDPNGDFDLNQSQTSIDKSHQLSESSLKLQKTDEIPPANKSIQLVEVLNNLIRNRNRKSKQNLNDFVTTRNLRPKTISFADKSETIQNDVTNVAEKSVLRAGRWRRSLIEWRKSRACAKSPVKMMTTVIEEESRTNDSMERYSGRLMETLGKSVLLEQSDEGNLHAALSILDGSIKCAATFHDQRKTSQRKTSVFERSSIFYGLQHSSILIETNASSSSPTPPPLTARQIALRRCGQQEPLAFDEVYSESQLPNCVKIGEGVFGEVFMFKCPSTNKPVVLKIIPIEGRTLVNGEVQKRFDEILQEIVISVELSALRHNQDCSTDGFVNVKRVTCVKGAYPLHLIDEWELFRDNRPEGSENDHPEIFGDDQLYIVFELCNGGRDLEAFVFNNSQEALSVFYQTALTLAVAEQKFEFEHRDLHWGNILIAPTTEKFVEYRINGKIIKFLTHGVKVTIIDYSLSRMVFDGAVLYDNLARDEELFEASGDYQFDIYRLMRQRVENDFERFEPFTNLLWLHYIIDKLINGARYRYTKTKKHRSAINELMQERDELLNFASASEYVDHMNF